LTVIGEGTSFPLAAFGGGKYFVYWDDNIAGPTYGRLITPDGVLVGPPIPLGSGAPRAVASDGANFLVVSEDNNSFYGQIVSAAGSLPGQRFLISGQPQNGNSATAIFGGGNYLVVWQSNNDTTGNDNKTYGEFVSSAGAAGAPFQISQTTSLDQNPLAAGFDGRNFLVVWNVDTSLNPDGSPIWSLYGRVVSPTGSFPNSERALATNQALFPSLAFDGANYLFSWSHNLDTTNSDKNVFFQFLDTSATPLGPAFPIFQAEGTNAPLMGQVSFNGSRFVAGASLGVLEVSPGGAIEGFFISKIYAALLPASTAPPRLALGQLSATQVSLQLFGTPGLTYAIQSSPGLAPGNWTTLVANSPTNGSFNYSDGGATDGQRFYRALKQ
jgi:hypothetical protein